ncbi:UPF0014 family [Paraphysoderma sedebokerense]|nr:UPF0014 family [Paraphysoderma sedebokerense]
MIVASIRCVVQLSIMGSVLTPVLRNNENPYIVFGMATALLSLGCIEAYLNKAKYRHSWMFLNIFVSMLISMIVSCAIGIQFAIPTTPFFNARMFIPTIGMLLGNTISGMALGLRTCLSHFVEKRDQIELLLSFGAGRWETAQPILKESISTGLLPVLNAMSVVGLISIPGQMTGQILAGAPIDQAVHYQQIIMFLIFSSTALGTIISCIVSTYIQRLHLFLF